MKKITAIILVILTILFLSLMIMNPTLKDFKEHIGFNDKVYGNRVSKKTNYLIFSTYEFDSELYSSLPYGYKRYPETHRENYVGVLMNFYRMK